MALVLTALLSGCNGDFSLWRQNDVVELETFVTETFEQRALAQVDLLFVVDDTGSMAQEHQALADSFAHLAGALDEQGLDWQLGVVCTDPALEGELLGDPWILTPAWPEPEEVFAETVDVGTEGTVNAGLASMALALSPAALAGPNRGFRRPDAALQVVVISDGDDESEPWLEDPLQDTLDLLQEEALDSGRPARLSAVVGDVPSGCSGANGTALPGTTYAAAAEATGGVVASICQSSLDEVLEELGALVVEVDDRFELSGEPYEGQVSRVTVDGQRQDEGWELLSQPWRVVFEVPPPAGSVVAVRYRLAEES